MKSESFCEKVIEHIETNILAGKLRVNDRLPAERKIAQQLNVSRASVREGIRIMEAFGIVECRRGSGNYIARNSDKTLKQALSMVYTLDDLHHDEILEFRYNIERLAMILAIRKMDTEDRITLQRYLDKLLHADPEERSQSDRMLHYTLVHMSGNQFLVSNYAALQQIIDRFIWNTHQIINEEKFEGMEVLQSTHRDLVQAVIDGDLKRGKEAHDRHYDYISRYLNADVRRNLGKRVNE